MVNLREPVPTVGNPLGWVAFGLALVALAIAHRYWGVVVFASWLAATFRPWHTRLVRATRLATTSSVLMTIAVSLVLVAPLSLATVVVVLRGSQWVTAGLSALRSGKLEGLISATTGGSGHLGTRLGDLYREAARATPYLVSSVGTVFNAVSDFVVQAFLLVLGTYSFFVSGERIGKWVEAKSPLNLDDTRHLKEVYVETGRGILVGVFLVLVVHGIVATIGYTVIGIGSPVELGFLTAIAGLVPAVGTALVWAPLAIVLAAQHHWVQAIAVFGLGLLIGMSDNILRPWLSKLGHVPMPTYLLFIAFFSGIVVFGPYGLLLGPLFFAMAKGAIDRWRC